MSKPGTGSCPMIACCLGVWGLSFNVGVPLGVPRPCVSVIRRLDKGERGTWRAVAGTYHPYKIMRKVVISKRFD